MSPNRRFDDLREHQRASLKNVTNWSGAEVDDLREHQRASSKK